VGTRVLSAQDVSSLFSFDEGIAALAQALGRLQAGGAAMPDRGVLRAGRSSEDLQVLTMPAHVGPDAPVVVKLSALAPGNAAKGLPLVHAVVAVLDGRTGQILALLEGASLTALRTGAMSALATRLLAREDARCVALIGAGEQAKTQLSAVCAVRDIERVRIHSRTRSRAEALARWAEALELSDVAVATSVEQALGGADIVCTATSTSSPVPLMNEEHVRPGTHFNAIGGVDERACELPPRALARSYTVVEQRGAALNEAGEVIEAIRLGVTTPSQIVEIGEIVTGRARGRSSAQEVTIFKSVGIAVQDAAIASMLYDKAVAGGVGVDVALGT
jgi:ornithine cyclodeaminase